MPSAYLADRVLAHGESGDRLSGPFFLNRHYPFCVVPALDWLTNCQKNDERKEKHKNSHRNAKPNGPVPFQNPHEDQSNGKEEKESDDNEPSLIVRGNMSSRCLAPKHWTSAYRTARRLVGSLRPAIRAGDKGHSSIFHTRFHECH